MKNKYVVGFYGGELLDGISVGDYMMCRINKDIELYAEIPLAGTEWENANDLDIPFFFSEYSYPLLKKSIIEQAKENDIRSEVLIFFWD